MYLKSKVCQTWAFGDARDLLLERPKAGFPLSVADYLRSTDDRAERSDAPATRTAPRDDRRAPKPGWPRRLRDPRRGRSEDRRGVDCSPGQDDARGLRTHRGVREH